ncbi:hypothetical protein HMPREF1981_01011 [Bacteroides pyogenes F0041]|uniref:Uncharacterized protein n=1 Tax=Bacteroides pyogenes F0041 TaxID=1321819 RepID=U2E1R8_9BACE|nr:hypothetical protein HMPREF1981_01011 [Bacteroides pyogenes F0041]
MSGSCLRKNSFATVKSSQSRMLGIGAFGFSYYHLIFISDNHIFSKYKQ